MPQGFEEFIRKALFHELSPMEHKAHPSLDLLLEGLSGDLAPDMRSRLAAHLATCPQCFDRWRKLGELLEEEERVLETKAKTASLPELLRQREGAKHINKVRSWLGSITAPFRLRPALAFSAAALAALLVVLGVTIPALKGANARLSSLTQEVVSLKEEIASLSAGFAIPSHIPSPPSREELGRLVKEAQGIDDPWQRSLFLASRLSSFGITIPASLDLKSTRTYTVKPHDTWETIAERELGDKALWTILYLLNVKEVPKGELSPGQEIRIPEKR